jgi:hypothetical protein
LHDVRQKLKRGDITISDTIVTILPQLRGCVSDETLMWLASELQGYANAVQFYQSDNHHLPSYRVVKGVLRLVHSGGKLAEVKHPFAQRSQYFLSAPVAWLEDFAKLPGEFVLVELPDLTAFLGGGAGNVACELTKVQLTRVLTAVRSRVIEVMDQVVPAK